MGGDPEASRCPEASGSKGPACHRSRLVAQGRGGVGTARRQRWLQAWSGCPWRLPGVGQDLTGVAARRGW